MRSLLIDTIIKMVLQVAVTGVWRVAVLSSGKRSKAMIAAELMVYDVIEKSGQEQLVVRYRAYRNGRWWRNGFWFFPMPVTETDVRQRAVLELGADLVSLQPLLGGAPYEGSFH